MSGTLRYQGNSNLRNCVRVKINHWIHRISAYYLLRTPIALTRILYDPVAKDKRIAAVPGLARAQRRVIHYLTNRVVSAEAWARILTFRSDTSSIRGAIGVYRALGSTTFVRVTQVIR